MCKYCNLDTNTSIMENEDFFAVFANTEERKITGHIQIVSKNHTGFFSLSYRNNENLFMMIRNCKKFLEKRLTPDGYSVIIETGTGIKEGHAVINLIPKYK